MPAHHALLICGLIVARQHFQQFNFKNEIRIGFYQRVDLAFAISEMCGNVQFAFTADLHAHQALVPAFNHSTGADHTLERFAFAVGGIEFGAVFEPAGVVGGDECAFDDGFAVANLQVFNNEFVPHATYVLNISC